MSRVEKQSIVQKWYALGRGANAEFCAKFGAEIPPNTVVWENEKRKHYGTTYSTVERGMLVTGIYGFASNP